MLLAIALVAAAAIPIYKWVDEAGTIHYSDQPPPSGYEGEALERLPAPRQDEAQRAQQQIERLFADLQASRCRASRQPGQNAFAKKGDFSCLGRPDKSLLVNGFAMRTGRSDSPRTLRSNFFRLPTMPDRRRHVA
jgi:hypothetical protein